MSDFIFIVCPSCNTTNRMPPERLKDHGKCGNCKSELFTKHPVELTQTTFSKHITENTIPVVVDFWAPWCGPCKAMAPFFEQAAAQLEPAVRFAKVNTDQEQELAGKYQISGVPTIIIFRSGAEIIRQSGSMNLSMLLNWLKPHF